MRIVILSISMCVIAQSGCRLFDEKVSPVGFQDHVPNTHPGIEAQELAIREAAIRHILEEQSNNSLAFIAFGNGENWIKPPLQFVDRFADLECRVKSIGMADLSASGMRLSEESYGTIYVVKIDHWLDNNSVAVMIDDRPYTITSGAGLFPSERLHVFEASQGNWVFSRMLYESGLTK